MRRAPNNVFNFFINTNHIFCIHQVTLRFFFLILNTRSHLLEFICAKRMKSLFKTLRLSFFICFSTTEKHLILMLKSSTLDQCFFLRFHCQKSLFILINNVIELLEVKNLFFYICFLSYHF
jgi:hypothetical protein